jgi:rhamnose transport system ATP-binding protein
MPELLRLQGIRKAFGGVQALRGAEFDLLSGEIHALVGENGAGKSTLIKIVSGVHRPDEGKVFLNGEPVILENPKIAQDMGIVAVHQEPSLYPDLSVLENLFVGRFLRKRYWLDWTSMHRAAEQVLGRLGVSLPLRLPLKQLSRAQVQLVQIARALLAEAKILILDEATAALSAEEVERLFGILEGIRARGVGIIYITHRLEEVFRIADRVTVLRDGEVVGRARVSEVDQEWVVRRMVGREVGEMYPRTPRPPGQPLLQVRGLTRHGVFQGVSFEVREGEVVALAGLVGSGRSEVARAIFGLDPYDEGEVRLLGHRISPRPWEVLKAGLMLLPEDRTRQGGILGLPVSWNISFSILDRLRKGWTLDSKEEGRLTAEAIQKLSVRPPDPGLPLLNLSGGNQQKVVLGRCLLVQPRVLILDEPTQGVDVGAKAEIHRIIDGLVAEALGVLLISSDLPEVLGMADRILVMHRGRLVAEFPRGSSAEVVMKAATGLLEAHYAR